MVNPPEQPYGPGAICDQCGHFALRHGPFVRQSKRSGRMLPGCDATDLVEAGIRKGPCNCRGMLWLGVRWPRPSLPAPDGLKQGEMRKN